MCFDEGPANPTAESCPANTQMVAINSGDVLVFANSLYPAIKWAFMVYYLFYINQSDGLSVTRFLGRLRG
jgi:hypothetical protein